MYPERPPEYCIVIGISAGGWELLSEIIPIIHPDGPPILIVQHKAPGSDGFMVDHLDKLSRVSVQDAQEKVIPQNGCVYFAPANYHLMVDHDRTLALSVDEKVNFSRPSIDVLFYSAADAFGSNLIGMVMTGANYDGAEGLKYIKSHGGLTVVQNPANAKVPHMPQYAMDKTGPHAILTNDELKLFFTSLNSLKKSPIQWAKDAGFISIPKKEDKVI